MHSGMANANLIYVGDQLILNYTDGAACHKIYKRSTEIYFSCHPDRHPVSFKLKKTEIQKRQINSSKFASCLKPQLEVVDSGTIYRQWMPMNYY